MADPLHLPPELTSFVGRGAELAAVADALAARRLLTLAGPGGCGKTRLAARAAARAAADWPDGVWWVDLAEEGDPDAVAARVGQVVGVPVPTGSRASVAAVVGHLRRLSALLVLDNCEHLVPGVALLVAAVLERCPSVGVLATSRATIGIAGERVWRVPPLSLADALELFLDRAGTPGGDGAVRADARRVCDRLDRLPLAVELAAGWAGTLSPAEIADSLVEPFALLDGGPRNAPFRQRSVEGSLRWSHDLLDPDERVLFRRLGVFEAGFTADLARAVGGADPLDDVRSLRALRGLIEKSLVVADPTGPAPARYRTLAVVRAYALARLAESGEADRTHDRHLDAYLRLAEGLRPLLDTDKDAWRAAVGAEYADIRVAVGRGLGQGDTRRGRRLAVAVAWLWHLGSRGDEGLRFLRRAVEAAGDEESVLQARVLTAVALVADTAEAGPEGYAAAEAAEAMARRCGDGPTARLAGVLAAIGRIGVDLDDARHRAVRVRDDARATGDAFVADAAQVLVGLTHVLRDRHEDAVAVLEPAADALLARGDRGVASTALATAAVARAHLGRLATAGDLAARAVAAAEPLRDLHRIGSALSVLAEVRALRGDLEGALRALEPVRRLVDEIGRSPYIPGWERTVAYLELRAGRPDAAVRWCRSEAGSSVDDDLTPDTRVLLAAALREAGRPAGARGLMERLAEVAAAAGTPRVRAAAIEQRAHLLTDEDPDAAVAAHHHALRLRTEHGLVLGCIDSLEALAASAWRRGAPESAATLLGAADRARTETGYAAGAARLPLLDDPDVADAVARGRTLDLRAAAAYAGRARGPRGRPTSGWGSLTPTEREVVDLAVEGLSNPQIGARLFMSRGTVKTHLAHVYAKLAVANRTELARLAGDRPGRDGVRPDRPSTAGRPR